MIKLMRNGNLEDIEYAPLGKKLKILVVEDKEKHIAGIERLLDEGHQVDVARNYVEVAKLLGWHLECGYETEGRQYDVILTDMFFTYGDDAPSSVSRRDEESPLGYAVALKAAQLGVPNVVIITDSNHHGGPIPATFDSFPCVDTSYDEETKTVTYETRPLMVNNAKLIMMDERDVPPLYFYEGKYFEGDQGRHELYDLKVRDNEKFQIKNYRAALHLLVEVEK